MPKRLLLALISACVFLPFQIWAQVEGSLSSRQKEHSKLFSNYKKPKKLSHIQPEKKSEIVVTYRLSPPLEEYSQEGAQPFLQTISCNSDAIVSATARSESSSVTANGDFIFTDHDFQIDKIFKTNSLAPFGPGTTIVVTRAGGKKLVNGRMITAVDEDFPPFQVGEQYLLFLRYVPSTGAYQAFNEGSFELVNGRVLPVASDAVWKVRIYRGQLESVFLTEVSTAVSQQCGGRRP